MRESCSLLLVLLLVVGLANVLIASVQAEREFDAHGTGVMRIASEVKVKLPIEQRDSVWEWLQKRFSAPEGLTGTGPPPYLLLFGPKSYKREEWVMVNT